MSGDEMLKKSFLIRTNALKFYSKYFFLGCLLINLRRHHIFYTPTLYLVCHWWCSSLSLLLLSPPALNHYMYICKNMRQSSRHTTDIYIRIHVTKMICFNSIYLPLSSSKVSHPYRIINRRVQVQRECIMFTSYSSS